MKTQFKSAAVALLLAAAAVPAAAQSLDQWAAEHFNRGVAVQDRQTVPGTITGVPSRAGTESFAASVGVSTAGYDAPMLSEVAARHFNRGVAIQDRQTVHAPVAGGSADTAQLAATAGAPTGASLDTLAAALFNQGESAQDRQTVAN
jgi:hypothetical protein